jgi:hypothetical protein
MTKKQQLKQKRNEAIAQRQELKQERQTATETKKRHQRIVDAVMASQAARDEVRDLIAASQQEARLQAQKPWKRIGAQLFGLALVGSLGFVVIAHALS